MKSSKVRKPTESQSPYRGPQVWDREKKKLTDHAKFPHKQDLKDTTKEFDPEPGLNELEKRFIRRMGDEIGYNDVARILRLSKNAVIGALADAGTREATLLTIRTHLKDLGYDANS